MSQATPAMSAASVKPTSLPISELLSSRSPAVVPQYQRAYAWEDDQVTDLINDVKLLLPTPTKSRGHFYGGMVAIRTDDAAEPSGHFYEIVDGQQRLATFCLLLAQIALRAEDLAESAMEKGAEQEASQMKMLGLQVRETYLYYPRYDVYQGTKTEHERVRLSKADDAVFCALLRGDEVTPSRESHHRLIAAAKLLRNELVWPETSQADPSIARNSLIRLRDATVDDSFVIHIVGENRSTGYRLFSVLNDRGARLTVADLLRSHTLEILDLNAPLRDNAALMWDDLLAEGGEVVDEFLMTYYTSLTGRRARRDDLFDTLVSLLFAPSSQPAEIIGRLQQMGIELTAYMAIQDGKWPYKEEDRLPNKVTKWQRERLAHLRRTLRHELADPLLLAARARCDEAQFAELVQLIEKFAFRYKNVCGAHATPASSAYYVQCKTLRDLSKQVDFSDLAAALRKLIEARANDRIFRATIETQLRYDGGGAARANIRHLLTMIEAHRPWIKQGAHGQPKPSMIALTDMDQVTIEHIYPQNARPVDPQFSGQVHRLGNLSYWAPDDNSAAGNDPFDVKKPAYAVSQVTLNQDLSKLPAWDMAALEKRENDLIKDACLIWKI
ncbi:DUF262 domain-containing protein [Actinomadura chibensis]|uniref:DUF262 domain-containing protein n=1 Tax=Actinomadura chibensis TaxID=392828 RepID=A0A5D0NUA6_9ACTN|nr:DUF262 domain-containing protein [Actinomadura chibensis]TYB47889.1 DUF262 domain-containing protein [Actinomadura chibensis]